MDCKRCAEDLTAFLDEELSDSDGVRSHIETCKSCSDELRSLRETAEFVGSHNRELELRAGSWNLVRARITSENASSPSRFWVTNRWRLGLATLAISAVFAFGYVQYHQIQRKNLDSYISQYLQERETWIKAHTVLTGTGVNSPAENPYADNPFVEIKATVTDNPFRSEDR